MRIHISTGPARKKPKVGDEKVIKGALHVRERDRVRSGPYAGALLSNNGRPVYIWVPKE